MDSLAVSVILGAFLIIASSFFPKKKSLISKYSNLSNDNLKNSRTLSKKSANIFLIVAFVIIPVLMAVVMPRIAGGQMYNLTLAVLIFGILLSIALYGVFQRITKIIESEIKSQGIPSENSEDTYAIN